jgi:hypothetical protein
VEKSIPQNVKDLKDQICLFEQREFDHRSKHILFSLYRDEEEPGYYFWTFSSLVVEVLMNARYNIRSADELRSLFTGYWPWWKGKKIEKFPMQDLATSTFRVKSLEGPDLGEVLQLGPFNANSRIIQFASEIRNELMLNIPISETFPAIDGVLVIPDARQVIYAQTVATVAHPIKFSLLKNVYNNLTQQNEFQGYQHILLFIVSNDTFDSFRFQPYKSADGKQDRTSRIDIEVKQYVGKVDSNI